MSPSFYETAVLFFAYSFLGWLAETAAATVKAKNFRNRGFASGPFCFIYGFTGVLLTVFLQDLKENAGFLFLGSMVMASAVEWFFGKLLERLKRKKWWDYSSKKWNFDGYICLQYSLLWGILGFLAVRYGNGIILRLYHFLPAGAGNAAVWILTVIGGIDFLGSVMSVCHMERKLARLFGWNRRLQEWTERFSTWISGRIEKRMDRSYPSIQSKKEDAETENGERCSLAELFWLFVIGAFAGDLVETVFCRITAGVWMSRSSLVWGHFSVVWGLAIALATALLYKDREKPDSRIFLAGVLLGGAYEYICSVFTEIVFGKIFWDYSSMPFNLGGRINLLYCFFWGIAAVVWIKGLYPHVARLIRFTLRKTGYVLTVLCVILMVFDICASMLALVRYDTRGEG